MRKKIEREVEEKKKGQAGEHNGREKGTDEKRSLCEQGNRVTRTHYPDLNISKYVKYIL